jgi:hypothetical protein
MSLGTKFPKLRKLLGLGDSHIKERTQGCWSCTHFSTEKAIELWWNGARKAMAARGAELAATVGLQDPRVQALRKTLPEMDVGMETRLWGICTGGGFTYTDGVKQPPFGDHQFIQSVFLCEKWTGAQGSSVAREGQKADLLPQEVIERHEEGN